MKSFWNADYGRPAFGETSSYACYITSGLMTRRQDQEDAYKTSLPL